MKSIKRKARESTFVYISVLSPEEIVRLKLRRPERRACKGLRKHSVFREPWRTALLRITIACAIVAMVVSTAVPSYASPVVHPGDTLNIDVLNYAAVVSDSQVGVSATSPLSALNPGNVTVAADGSISIPVLKSLYVSGKTTDEIALLIESRFKSYIKDPAVTVQLVQQSQRIFLTGATIGALPYLPGETLSSALGQLREQLEKDVQAVLTPSDKNGGTLSRSPIDLRKIVIERDNRRSGPIDGEELLISGRPGPMLVPGDTLLFANKPVRVDVRGEVAAPGPIFLYDGSTLEQALLLAGGPLGTASTADASLLRKGTEAPLPLGDAALRQNAENGDAIIVRAAPHVTVLGQVPTPGEFALKNGSTLLSALYIAGGPNKWANMKDIQVVHRGSRQSYNLSTLRYGDLSSDVPLSDGDVVFVPEGHRIDATLFFQALATAFGGIYDTTHR